MEPIPPLSTASPPLLTLQEAIVECKPRWVVAFATRYLHEENTAPPQLVSTFHAMQRLPYLLSSPAEFQDVACSIYCSLLGLSGGLLSEATGVNSVGLSNRTHLNGGQVVDLLQLLDLPSIGLQSAPSVEEILIDRIDSLKRIDFSLFVSCLRLVINVTRAVAWCKDELFDFLSTGDRVLQVCFPLLDDTIVDVARWKVFLLKRAVSASGGYRQSPLGLSHSCIGICGPIVDANGTTESQLWTKQLVAILDEESVHSTEMRLQMLLDKFTKSLLHCK